MSLDIKVTGVNEVVGRIDLLIKSIDEANSNLQQDVEDMIDMIVVSAKETAPVRTGALRDSIHSEGSYPSFNIIVDVPYAKFVEFGTSKMPAQPYLWPSIYIVIKAFKMPIIRNYYNILRR